MKIVGYNDIRDAINAMEQFQSEKPDIFIKIRQAWSLARPIIASYDDVNHFLIKGYEIGQILSEKVEEMRVTLYPGGIYSIFSEKTQYGMGKSQIAHFLKLMYERAIPSALSEYHIFDPSEEGFNAFNDQLRLCFSKCNNNREFYFFVDEIDLISAPEISEERKVILIERFGNILIRTSEEAYNRELPFYIFLVLSNRILEDFERYAPHRIKRRINPFLRADILFDENDIEEFAVNFFAVLWASNYKNIKTKLRNYHYRFKELMGNLLTHFIENLDFLKLDIQSSVVGDLVERLRNMFEIIFDGVDDDQLGSINLGNESEVGSTLEGILKTYLLRKNRPFIIQENGNNIIVSYKNEEKVIKGHRTDGYYDFKIGDNEIGFMPVEITAQRSVNSGRKKRQLKAFTEKHMTLLIWIYINKRITDYELRRFDEEVSNELQRILLPRDLIQYILMVKDRAFSLLEDFRKDIMGDIETFLKKYAKILYNKWMIGQPIVIPPTVGTPTGGVTQVNLEDIDDRVSRLLENTFQYLDGATKRSHKGMKAKIEEELKGLQTPLQNIGVDWPFFDLNTIYRELTQELNNAGLCRYTTLEDRSYLVKIQELFTVNMAVDKCKRVISSRIEDKVKNLS